MADEIVRMSGIVKTVPGNARLLHEVDLRIEAGSSTAIVGRSGSGKSTLLSVLALLDAAESGTYAFRGRDVATMSLREREALRGGAISLVFQRFALLSHLSARENVMVPLRHRGGRGRKAMRREAADALGAVGMTGHENKRPRTLSGGEQQRVAIARALVTRPELILADEPTGALDASTADEVMKVLVQQTQDRGSALVIVTHDDAVARGCDRVLHLDAGHLTVSGPRAAASCS